MKNLISKLKSYKFSTYMLCVTIFYAMGSILINLMAVKTLGVYDTIDFSSSHFGNAILPITTAGTVMSWLIFACMDINTEVNGKKSSIQMFWTVGISNLLLTAAAALIVFIPGNPHTEKAYETVFGVNWGIAVASMLAFLIGNYINTTIMYNMKVKAKNKTSGLGFTLRAGTSTLFGQLVDNALFYILALAPVISLGALTGFAGICDNWGDLAMIVGFTTLFELGIEVIFSPVTHKFCQFLIKKKEEEAIIN